MKIQTLILVGFALGLSACSSMSNLADVNNVKVSREDADKDCVSLGKIEGRAQTKTANEQAALEDLKKEAANKGANYLVVKQFSGYGTSVSGLAYKCP